MTRPKIVLIDGHSLAYRAFFALPPTMATADGFPTNAVYGFSAMLLKILAAKPAAVIVSFDRPKPTFRHSAYTAYKANRPVPAESFIIQQPVIRQVIDALGITVVEKDGYEADDLIGTLAKKAERDGWQVGIVTGDLDTLQLVDNYISVETTRKGVSDTVIYNEKAVEQRFNLKPDQLIDYKALRGDPSDNVPGVPGIGEKTAQELIGEFKTLDDLYANLDKVKKASVREKLEANKDKALLSKFLVTIDTQVPLEIDLNKLPTPTSTGGQLEEIFKRLEFNSLLAKFHQVLGGAAAETATEEKPGSDLAPVEASIKKNQANDHQQLSFFAAASSNTQTARQPDQGAIFETEVLQGWMSKAGPEIKKDYRVIDLAEDLPQLAAEITEAGQVAFDTETTGLDPLESHLVGVSLATSGKRSFYLPVAAPAGDKILGLKTLMDFLRPILASQKIAKFAHNGKYDALILKKYDVELNDFSFDTMIAAWLLDPDRESVSLKELGRSILGEKMSHFSELLGLGGARGKKNLKFSDVPLSEAANYACADAAVCFRLKEIFAKDLKEKDLEDLFGKVEMPMSEVLTDMEEVGVAIDTRFLRQLAEKFADKLDDLEKAIHKLGSSSFNINSSQQLADVLFTKLKLPAGKRTKTGVSTDSSVLEDLADKHPIIKKIIEYRQLTKLKSTYLDALPALINPKTGRVHSSFNQTGTSTGRLSSSEPNLQNIPIRTEEGRLIRKAFIAGHSGWKILSADYSQIELRLMAHFSGDPNLVEAFKQDKDIHAATAAAVLKIPEDQVKPEQRQAAKAINFGIIYGMGATALAGQLGISRKEAQQFIDDYFQTYAKVKEYIEQTVAEARRRGYVTTILKRRRYLPDIQSNSGRFKSLAERTAINSPLQGSAADIIKLAMIKIHRRLKDEKLKSRLILQVHDELLLEVAPGEVNKIKDLVKDCMEDPSLADKNPHDHTSGVQLALRVPLKVSLGLGPNWLEAK